MPYTTINSGDYIESSWANANVRDQVVTPFATSATRASTITSPVKGMVSTLTTNTASEGIYQYLSSNVWRLPWNLPWGNLDISATPASFTFNSTIAYSSTFTWSSINRRQYLVTFGGEFQNGSVTGVYNTVGMYASTTAQSLVVVRNTPAQANAQESGFSSFLFTGTTTGTVTWRLGAVASASATNQTFVPYSIIIQDIGPNGAPA